MAKETDYVVADHQNKMLSFNEAKLTQIMSLSALIGGAYMVVSNRFQLPAMLGDFVYYSAWFAMGIGLLLMVRALLDLAK